MNDKSFSWRPRRGIRLNKAVGLAVFSNAVQILAAAAIGILTILGGGSLLQGAWEQLIVGFMALIVIWGAVADIREARLAKRIQIESDMLEDAYGQLEDLNKTLRAQRHDFLNHLQVVYSLVEMEEYDDAKTYVNRVCDDIQSVSKSLKTAIPAVNALLAAKVSAFEEKGVSVRLEVKSAWKNCSLEGWTLCRVLGNLLDNARDAALFDKSPEIRVEISENDDFCLFTIENNGKSIPAGNLTRIFEAGFSTKSKSRGMGLSIVRSILSESGGDICVDSQNGRTRFTVRVPKTESKGAPA